MVEYEAIDLESDSEISQILKKDFIASFRKGYGRFGPEKFFLPERFKDFADEILNMEVYPDDVWLISHPKTGTTWCQEMTWCLDNNLDYKAAEVPLFIRFPFLDLSFLFDYRELLNERPDIEIIPLMENSVEHVKNFPRPRFIKCHIPWSLLPKQITEGKVKPKIIYVCRNAKDTCVSYYHHSKLMEGYTGNFEDFCKLFLNDAVSFNPYWEHVLGFWERRNHENILFLKYEDLKKDLYSQVKKTANFLKKSYSENELETLCEHLSFESMKKNPSVNYEEVVEFNKRYGIINEDGHFMRSGTVGNFKAHMTPEIIAEFDAWTKRKIQGSGLDY